MTISELVEQSGAQMRVFDMGRRIQALDNETFGLIEKLSHPYPSPYLKHAWLGILSWHPSEPGQHGIWFLKLPLDEHNLLEPAARDAFVGYCAQRMQQPGNDQGEAPYSFKPDAHRMAYFHALAAKQLGAGSSRFYTTARAYLSGDIGWDNWQQLGLQGLAEVIASIDSDNNDALITRAIPYLPQTPLNVLLGFMENIAPSQQLTSALNDRLAQVITAGASADDLAAFARALSRSDNIEQRRLLVSAILKHPQAAAVEVLAAISSRCWADLEGDLLVDFLETLALNSQGQQAFQALVADMMTLSGMRHRMLTVFARTDLSPTLMTAVKEMLSLVRGSAQ